MKIYILFILLILFSCRKDEKIKIDESINFENNLIISNTNYKTCEKTTEENSKIREAEHYINLLNSYK